MNSSVNWMNPTERRSLMRPSLPLNGTVLKESFIPEEEVTTNLDAEVGGNSRKTMPSLSNTSLRIGFVHQEDAGQTAPVVVTSGLVAPHPAIGQQQATGLPSGIYHRTSKPTEWRIHIAHVKVRILQLLLHISVLMERLNVSKIINEPNTDRAYRALYIILTKRFLKFQKRSRRIFWSRQSKRFQDFRALICFICKFIHLRTEREVVEDDLWYFILVTHVSFSSNILIRITNGDVWAVPYRNHPAGWITLCTRCTHPPVAKVNIVSNVANPLVTLRQTILSTCNIKRCIHFLVSATRCSVIEWRSYTLYQRRSSVLFLFSESWWSRDTATSSPLVRRFPTPYNTATTDCNHA